jgi:DNA primase large subunit
MNSKAGQMLEDTKIYEAAKYPWSISARRLLKELDISLKEIDADAQALQLARSRLLQALETREPATPEHVTSSEFVELTSFFVAKVMVDAIKSMFFRRRWATAEAKRAERYFFKESDLKLAQLATRNFNWRLDPKPTRIAGREFSHRLHFANYLAATAGFHEREWKLVNKRMVSGYVLLRKGDTARVLRAAVEQLLISDVKQVSPPFPPNIQQFYEELEIIVHRRTERMKQEILGEIIPEAFPPCIQALLADMTEGKPLSHIARFTITSFLLNVGMDVDSILNLFVKAPDFREDLARYQIEHIAGKRGSTEYTPPACAYLVSTRLCVKKDKHCEFIRHPLAYYRRRRKWIKPKSS